MVDIGVVVDNGVIVEVLTGVVVGVSFNAVDLVVAATVDSIGIVFDVV